jgi:hypothetical protein
MSDKATEDREKLIQDKMRRGNMTRENAELVVQHQEENDAKREKAPKKKKEEGAQ